MRRIAFIAASLPLLIIPATPAYAHAFLDHANPPVGSSVAKAPREVVLWFTQNLEPAFSQIDVQNASGSAVNTGKANVNSADHTQLRVSLKALPPGTYKVIWRVLSVDTHRTNGSFTFRVGP